MDSVGVTELRRNLSRYLRRLALRALDAIHVAAALELSPLDAFVSYDERQAAAARLVGLKTIAPVGPV